MAGVVVGMAGIDGCLVHLIHVRCGSHLHTGLTPVATRFCGSSEFFGAEPGRLR